MRQRTDVGVSCAARNILLNIENICNDWYVLLLPLIDYQHVQQINSICHSWECLISNAAFRNLYYKKYHIQNAYLREQFKRSLKSWLFECAYGRRRVWETVQSEGAPKKWTFLLTYLLTYLQRPKLQYFSLVVRAGNLCSAVNKYSGCKAKKYKAKDLMLKAKATN